MRILQVNCVYKKGSTGKIVYDIHQELLKQHIDSVVCYGRGEVVGEPNVYKTCGELYSKINNIWSRINGLKYGGLYFSTLKLEHIIENIKPDIVHLHCINGYFVNIYKIIRYLKYNNIKTVVSLHAEFMHTANCGHALKCEKWQTGCGHCPVLKLATKSFFIDGTARSWELMKQAFDGFNENLIVTSVSSWLMERAKLSPILAGKKHVVVMNGIDTNIFHAQNYSKLRRKYGFLENEKIVFHATPSFTNIPTDIKGGRYLIELATKMPDITFIVAGPHNEIKVSGNIILLGNIDNQNVLSEFYALSDVTILTSEKETFSMVCAESLSCGTPVVGFMAGGPESIALPEYSEWVEYGNIYALKDAINTMFNMKIDKKDIALKAHSLYDRTVMTNNYISVFRELL